MSTRSIIARLNDDKSVDAIYCHRDGYLSGVGLELIQNYHLEPEALDRLIELGYLEDLNETPEKSRPCEPPLPALHFDSLDALAKHLQKTNSWVEYVYYGEKTDGFDDMEVIDWWVAHNHNKGTLNYFKIPSIIQAFDYIDEHFGELADAEKDEDKDDSKE